MFGTVARLAPAEKGIINRDGFVAIAVVVGLGVLEAGSYDGAVFTGDAPR